MLITNSKQVIEVTIRSDEAIFAWMLPSCKANRPASLWDGAAVSAIGRLSEIEIIERQAFLAEEVQQSMARTQVGGCLLASFVFAGAAGSSQNFEHTVNFSSCSSHAWRRLFSE